MDGDPHRHTGPPLASLSATSAGEGTRAGGQGSYVAASGPLCGAGEAGRRRRLGARCRLGGEAVCAAAATAPASRGQGERAERRVPPPPEPELRLGIEWMALGLELELRRSPAGWTGFWAGPISKPTKILSGRKNNRAPLKNVIFGFIGILSPRKKPCSSQLAGDYFNFPRTLADPLATTSTLPESPWIHRQLLQLREDHRQPIGESARWSTGDHYGFLRTLADLLATTSTSRGYVRQSTGDYFDNPIGHPISWP